MIDWYTSNLFHELSQGLCKCPTCFIEFLWGSRKIFYIKVLWGDWAMWYGCPWKWCFVIPGFFREELREEGIIYSCMDLVLLWKVKSTDLRFHWVSYVSEREFWRRDQQLVGSKLSIVEAEVSRDYSQTKLLLSEAFSIRNEVKIWRLIVLDI